MNWIPGSSVWFSCVKTSCKNGLDQFCVDSKWGKRINNQKHLLTDDSSLLLPGWVCKSSGSVTQLHASHLFSRSLWDRYAGVVSPWKNRRHRRKGSWKSWVESRVDIITAFRRTCTLCVCITCHRHGKKIIGWRVNYFSKGAYSVSSSFPPRLLDWLFEGGQRQIAPLSSLIVIKYAPCGKTEGCREQLAAETPLVRTCLCASCCELAKHLC